MKVTYIHHSGFFVELAHVCLLFDYEAGSLPEIPEGKAVVIFASHRHGDHFCPDIFQMFSGDGEAERNVSYVLSHDIRENRVPEEKRSHTVFVKPHTVTKLMVPLDGQEETEALEVETFRSTDEGVAFLVRCEGCTLYHAGDLNNWYWKGEPDSWNHNMAANYQRELEKIREALGENEIDAAFVPLDPRLEEYFYLGLDGFMRTVGARNLFPMHCWDRYEVIAELKEMDCSREYRERIAEIKKAGDRFEPV